MQMGTHANRNAWSAAPKRQPNMFRASRSCLQRHSDVGEDGPRISDLVWRDDVSCALGERSVTRRTAPSIEHWLV